MTGREIFKIWAPTGCKWVDWVRPVPFVAINNPHRTGPTMNNIVPKINYMSHMQENTAIFLDLPGCDSIKEGLALAGMGYRPIPLYNGTTEQQGAMPIVDNHTIENALIWGAYELEKLNIAQDAPPAFLLDSNRTHRFRMCVSIFDNSWDLYDQDIPSAEYFIKNGISRIIIRGETIQRDLVRILHKFPKMGISVLFTNGYEEPKEATIRKPPRRYEKYN